MPTLDWCVKPTDWYKECSQCKTGFWVETEAEYDRIAACELMYEFFSPGHYTTSDGLWPQCRSCVSNVSGGRKHGVHRDVILEEQEGRCAIASCRKEISFKRRTAFVDHCHKSGMTRAVLCGACNAWMAGVDNDEWLVNAIAYRDRFRCE